jgi:hypothetical protein
MPNQMLHLAFHQSCSLLVRLPIADACKPAAFAIRPKTPLACMHFVPSRSSNHTQSNESCTGRCLAASVLVSPLSHHTYTAACHNAVELVSRCCAGQPSMMTQLSWSTADITQLSLGKQLQRGIHQHHPIQFFRK